MNLNENFRLSNNAAASAVLNRGQATRFDATNFRHTVDSLNRHRDNLLRLASALEGFAAIMTAGSHAKNI